MDSPIKLSSGPNFPAKSTCDFASSATNTSKAEFTLDNRKASNVRDAFLATGLPAATQSYSFKLGNEVTLESLLNFNSRYIIHFAYAAMTFYRLAQG
jgi:hypothetical protein